MKLENCHAIITGGASGLGAATAAKIIGEGGKATIIDQDEQTAISTSAALGENSQYLVADVTDEAGIINAVDDAQKNFGQISLLANCAGIGSPGRILGRKGVLPLANYSKVISVNLIGSFNVLKAVANVMQDNTADGDGCRGLIVNTASVAGFEGQVGQVAYSSSKGGIIRLTLPAARDLAQHGIRVVTIAPGLFDTPMMDGLPQDVQDSLAKGTPFPQRLGKAHEYAELVLSIFTNNMINGETIRLDGAVRLAPR